MKQIRIYTDGACSGNNNKNHDSSGGIGAVMSWNEHEKEVSFGFNSTTNNQMELLAPIVALTNLKERCDVLIFSDSAYVVNGFEKKWIVGWKKNGWKNASGKDVKNQTLWKALDRLVRKHNVKFKHVKAHSGIRLNERADVLAVRGSKVPKKYDVDKFLKELMVKVK